MGPIALVGGDEFRAGCEPMDRGILAVAGATRPKVLVLPTAAADQNPAKAAANGVAYFARLGVLAESLMVLDSRDADDDGLVSRVTWADVVYLTGGDPAHLLEVLRGSRLLEAIRTAVAGGSVLAGSSAGAMVLGDAMVLGEWMRYGGIRPALGLLDGLAVLPTTRAAARTQSPPSLRRPATQVAPSSGLTREPPALAEKTAGGSSGKAPSFYTPRAHGGAFTLAKQYR